MNKTKPEVFSKKLNADVGINWIAEEIEAIAAAMKEIQNSRASMLLIVELIHARTGLAKSKISDVLGALIDIEKDWLKPRGKL